jgi:putative endonuclease
MDWGRTAYPQYSAMTSARIGLGRRGEELASAHLAGCKYAIVERNYRCPHGEIDLIARQGTFLVFVEVRTRRGVRFGTPEESITTRKRAHLIAAGQHYLQEHNLVNVDWRIDFVSVRLSPAGQLLSIRIIPNAVTG